jgi:hypothetical protein
MQYLNVLKTKLEFGNAEQIQALRYLAQGEECEECENRIHIDLEGYPVNADNFAIELHGSPFDGKSRTAYYCSEECLDRMTDTSWSDFRYFDCPCCDRMICEQNPSNGYHTQYRIYQNEQICLKCYEKIILENGVDREEFEEGRLPGMFLSSGNEEAISAGYKEVEGFVDYRVGDGQPICDKALALIDEGCKVILAYESMAIGGLEGYVTLLAKN